MKQVLGAWPITLEPSEPYYKRQLRKYTKFDKAPGGLLPNCIYLKYNSNNFGVCVLLDLFYLYHCNIYLLCTACFCYIYFGGLLQLSSYRDNKSMSIKSKILVDSWLITRYLANRPLNHQQVYFLILVNRLIVFLIMCQRIEVTSEVVNESSQVEFSVKSLGSFIWFYFKHRSSLLSSNSLPNKITYLNLVHFLIKQIRTCSWVTLLIYSFSI